MGYDIPERVMPPACTPQRIVSLQPSATVILDAIGALDRLVACTRYCAEVCPQATVGRTIVADSWSANATEILASRPDLVIAAVPYQEKSVSAILKAGVRFLGLAPRTLADIYIDIASIAGIVGLAECGETVVQTMRKEIEQVRHQTRELPRRKVFCEEWGKPLIASQPWVAELVEAAGGEFVVPSGVQTALQTVEAANPEVLIAAWCGAGSRVPLEKVVRQRRWQDIAAVRQQRVYCIADELLNTPAPTLLAGLHALAAAIHPERFPQVSGLRRISDVSRETRPTTAPLV
jgi:iron complex transport system substrate-binding protein